MDRDFGQRNPRLKPAAEPRNFGSWVFLIALIAGAVYVGASRMSSLDRVALGKHSQSAVEETQHTDSDRGWLSKSIEKGFSK